MRAQTRSPFEGMWTIAPATPEGDACRTACTDAGVARLNPDYFTANLGGCAANLRATSMANPLSDRRHDRDALG